MKKQGQKQAMCRKKYTKRRTAIQTTLCAKYFQKPYKE